MISPGKYIAQAAAIRFIKPKDILAYEVRFTIKDEQNSGDVNWTGYTSEAAQKMSIKALNVLQYNGDDKTHDVPQGHPLAGLIIDQDCINRKKEVQIEVDHNVNKDTGVTYARVKWVNEIGGGQFAGAVVQVIQNDLNASGFKAAFFSSKQNEPSQKSESTFNEQDVPF